MTTLSKPDQDGLVYSEWQPTLRLRRKLWPSKRTTHIVPSITVLQQLHYREVRQEPDRTGVLQYVGGLYPCLVRTEHKWFDVPVVETVSDEETL